MPLIATVETSYNRTLSLPLPLTSPLSTCPGMLSNRLCSGCRRQLRLSTTIQSPRCPACRFSLLPPIRETRPCLRCFVPIPADSPNIRCMPCDALLSSNPHYSPCYDRRLPFAARPGVMRCRNCRLRRSSVVQRPSDFRQTIGISFDTNLNSFPPLTTTTNPPQLKRRRSIHPALLSTSQSSVIDRAIEFLVQEHESRVLASGLFPPNISIPLVRQSIARFEKEMTVSSRDISCCSCGMLIPSNDTRQFLDRDPVLEPLAGFLDRCGYIDGFWNLCSGCHASLLRGSVPKFSAGNKINVVLCQHYPDALKDLTLTEEYMIAKSHPVGVILKLRPGGRSSSANYSALRGHFIVVP